MSKLHAKILGLLKKKKEPGHLNQSNQPEPVQPESIDKTQFLLAFRTITLMLSLIQSRKRVTKIKIEYTPELRKELKPLDALAAIAIRQHGIAAATVAMRHSPSGTLQILASSDSPSSGATQTSSPASSPASSPTSKLHEWFKIIILLTLNARNDRSINQEAPGQSLKIVDPDSEIPESLRCCKESDLLKTYLKDVWPNRDEVLDKSFYTHMWMISKLLGRDRSGSRPFLLYVIAACYLKMLIRIEYRTSETIANFLKKVQTFDFSEKIHEARTSEKEIDRTFLSTFLRYQPLLDLQTDTPNLIHRAELETLPHEHDFYTKETCLEFHLLLSEVLERFHQALKILDSSRGKVGVDEILVQLALIARLGYLFRLMVKGTAIKKHLQVIEDFLPDRPPPQAVQEEEDGDGDGDGDEDEDEDGDDRDEDDGKDIGHGSNAEAQVQPKWQRWSDRLEVMVIHFDSTQILNGFVKSYGSNLDVKVLWQPLPDNKLLNWKELLRLIAPSSAVADDLIQFLEPKVIPSLPPATPENVCMLLNNLDKIPRVEENVVVFAEAIDHITLQMRSLINHSVPWSEPSITSMVDALHSLKKTWIQSTHDNLIKETSKIFKKFSILMKRPAPTAESVSRLVDDLGKISRVAENVVVFAKAIDHITPQMRTLTNYTIPWSEPSIISMVDTLDSLKDTWIHTTRDDLIKEISRISRKIKASAERPVITAEDVSVLVRDLEKMLRVEESVFTNAVDHIISQVKTLMTPLPWSEALITSIVGKLNVLKGTWKCTTHDALIKDIAQIVEAIKTLTKRPTAEDLGRMVKDLGKIRQVGENVALFIHNVDQIVFQMAALTNCSSPWSESFIRSIVDKLNSFKNMWVYTTQEDSIKEIMKIAEMIRTLRDNAKFFYALEPSEPLCTGIGFRGVDHCESCLVAFCCVDPEWSQIGGKRGVGVSKRCCPSCAHLLGLLDRFVYTHSHNTITACSLPESLPLLTIFRMVTKFGDQLIDELLDLKARTEMLSSIDPSIGSGKVSVGSEYESQDLLEDELE